MADSNALVNALALAGSDDPAGLIRNQFQAQQQQQLAAALMQQGLNPMGGTQSIGGVAIRTSPMEGIAKLAALLSGQSMQGQATDKAVNAVLAQQQGLQGAVGMNGAQQPLVPRIPGDQTGVLSSAALGSGSVGDYAKLIADANKPTEATLTAQQGGLDPQMLNRIMAIKQSTDPEILRLRQAGMSDLEIYKAMYGAAAKGAEIDRRSGQQFQNPVLGQAGQVPTLPPNANPTGAPGPTGALPGVATIPGAPSVVAGTEAAKEAEKILPKVQTASGATVPMRAGTAIAAPNLGQSTESKELSERGARIIADAPQSVAQSKSSVTGLERALDYLQTVKSGPGTAKGVNVLALLNNAGVPLLAGDVSGYQTMQKFLQNSLNQAAQGTGATGSDARFESFMKGQPNAETMNADALNHAIRYVLGQSDANVARGQFLASTYETALKNNIQNPGQYAQDQWSKTFKPDFFMFNRMDPQEQAQFLKSKGAGARDFVKQYNDYASFTGWVK